MLKTFEYFTSSNLNDVTVYKMKIKDLEQVYKYFHVSTTLLITDEHNKTFTFTPRIPLEPFHDDDYNIIEDDFTKRISLAPKIKKCIEAIPEDDEMERVYVYGVDLKSDSSDDIETINLKTMLSSCPVIKGKKYGKNFNLHDWLRALPEESYKEIQTWFYKKTVKDLPDLKREQEFNIESIDLEEFIQAPSDLPDKYKKLFYACVPDADKSNEFWSLKNLKMDYLGEFEWLTDYVTLKIKKGEEIPSVIKNIAK